LAFYETLDSGLAVIREIANKNPNRVNVLLLDENLTPRDHSGNDGRLLFDEAKMLGLLKWLKIVNISGEPHLGEELPYVGPFVSELETLLIGM
jgi:hypothetical protein